MLPLAGDSAPTQTLELAEALQKGLVQNGATAEVAAEGAWPSLTSLVLRLSKLDRPRPLPKVAATQSITIERFELSGKPVTVEGVPATVQAEFSRLGCGFARAGDGPWQLVVLTAEAGRLDLSAAKAEVEQAAHQIVSELAEKQGATVKSTSLNLTSINPRSVRFEISCTAKVFIASATLTVSGQLEVDDHLNARLSGLSVAGDGMIASMAQSMIQPRLAALNGKVVPLGEYMAAGLTVRELKITAGDRLRLEATFGPKASGV